MDDADTEIDADIPTPRSDEEALEGMRIGAARLAKNKHWHYWVAVGHGLLVCRCEALRRANTNHIDNNKARAAMADVLREQGVDGRIEKSVRSNLLALMDNLASVNAWRATLTLEQQLKWNHPHTVFSHWKKARLAIIQANNTDDEPPVKRAPKRDTMAELGAKGMELDEVRAENEPLKVQLEKAEERIAELEAQLNPQGRRSEPVVLYSLPAPVTEPVTEPDAVDATVEDADEQEADDEPVAQTVGDVEWAECALPGCKEMFAKSSKGRPKMYCCTKHSKAASKRAETARKKQASVATREAA